MLNSVTAVSDSLFLDLSDGGKELDTCFYLVEVPSFLELLLIFLVYKKGNSRCWHPEAPEKVGSFTQDWQCNQKHMTKVFWQEQRYLKQI